MHLCRRLPIHFILGLISNAFNRISDTVLERSSCITHTGSYALLKPSLRAQSSIISFFSLTSHLLCTARNPHLTTRYPVR